MKVFFVCLVVWIVTLAAFASLLMTEWSFYFDFTWYSTTTQVIFVATLVVFDLALLALVGLAGVLLKDLWVSS